MLKSQPLRIRVLAMLQSGRRICSASIYAALRAEGHSTHQINYMPDALWHLIVVEGRGRSSTWRKATLAERSTRCKRIHRKKDAPRPVQKPPKPEPRPKPEERATLRKSTRKAPDQVAPKPRPAAPVIPTCACGVRTANRVDNVPTCWRCEMLASGEVEPCRRTATAASSATC